MTGNTETFEEVLEVSKKVYEYCKQELQDKKEQQKLEDEMLLKEQLEEERQKKTLQDARITTMIKSFTNYIKVHFKKDAIATSLKGKHEITYSLQDINFSTTILKDYDLDQFNSLLHHSNYQDFLNQTFTGFNIENKIISNSMKLIEDLKLKISWNN